MSSVLSYFRSYFAPGTTAPLGNHSAGLIASALHEILAERGPVAYFDQADEPRGITADLYVGHFYTFTRFCRDNEFRKKIAFYSISDPDRRERMLRQRAAVLGVPLAPWDAPPEGFDHEETMNRADLVFVVGNEYTRQTFPSRHQPKIRMLNYSVDQSLFRPGEQQPGPREMVYVATSCGLRKGFMDVLRVWSQIPPERGTLYVVGDIEPPWDQMLEEYDTGSIRYVGWIDSDDRRYGQILRRCRHAYLPTYEEGQMGTALEALFSGCIPITTRASGLDDRVLEHCIIVEPMDIEGQRRAVLEALSSPPERCDSVREALLSAARAHHGWGGFRREVSSGIEEVIRA